MTSGPSRDRRGRAERLALTGLLLLTVIPVAAGAVRLTQLGTGVPVSAENARFFHSPVPVVVHIVAATVFCVLGAFQVLPGHHRRHPGPHRWTGRMLVVTGTAAALSGLWMTLAYRLPAWDGPLLNLFRSVFGTAMVVALVLGHRAIRHRDVRGHQAWMLRGYAIGLGAGTQVLTVGPFTVLLGQQPSGVLRALAMLAGWTINLAVVEWYLRTGNRAVRGSGTTGAATVRAGRAREGAQQR